MSKITNGIIATTGLLFWSCAGDVQRGATGQGVKQFQGGFVVPDGQKWPGGVIPVCWATSGFEADKILVENAVTTEIQSRSKLRFTGWNELCPGPTPSNKLQIIIDRTRPRATQGYHGPKESHVMNMNFTLGRTWQGCQSEQGKKICHRNIALHEFMHVAGVVHEHERDDSTCPQRNPQGAEEDAKKIGKYDPDSIMDYCNENFFKVAMSLSQGDLASLRYLYP